MKKAIYIISILLAGVAVSAQDGMVSIQAFGVLPDNSASVNKANLQKAIDWATASGGALYVEPAEKGYHVETGIILKRNVSLIGAHGPTGRGTSNADRTAPTGSLFIITDTQNPFITVESATQIKGIQFYYPEQAHADPSKIIEYKPTIAMSHESGIVEGVTLMSLTFYGEYMAMDFRAAENGESCEQILIQHCYGYPLSGEFIAIDRCYDIPRILNCHVNPANMREFGRSFDKQVIDAVVAKKAFSYFIDHTDNAQLIDVFTFGVYGGVYLGESTYGQLTNFNLDCVTIGIYKSGDNQKNRNWQIAQGSIIANTAPDIKDVHPFVIEGRGHTAITNVECFSGDNPALSNLGASFDFMTVNGDDTLTVSLFGCRMQGYVSDDPFTVNNENAKIEAVSCINKDQKFFNYSSRRSQQPQYRRIR